MANLKQTIEFQAKGIAKLKKQYKELEKRTKGLESSTRRASGSMGGMIAKLGITTAALYVATKAISGVVKVGAGFEKAMSNVAAITGATGKELQALEKNAKDLGSSTVFTASQVAELQTEFAKLGFTSKQITAVTKDTLALASATGSDLATSAAVAGQTLRAFGLGVEETSRVTDTMAKSFSASALDMDKFTNSMQYVAPIAKQVGLSIESTTGMLGTLANAGISGSMAGTSLRKILLELGNESSKLGKRIGFPVKSADDLQKAFKQLNKEGLTTAEMEDLVGTRAISAFNLLLEGADKTAELTKAFENSAGAAQRMADVQLDNLSGKMTLLNSAMEGLGISIFDHFVEPLGGAVESMTSFIGAVDDYMKIPVSEKLREESARLNTLVSALKRNIDKEEVRKRLLIELNKNYPDFLKNIDQEKMTIAEIETALRATNKQYKEKIKIAVAEELIAKKLKESSSAFDEQTKAGIRAENQLITLSKYTGIAVDAGKSLGENLAMQSKKYDELRKAQFRGKASTDALNKLQKVTGTGYRNLGDLVGVVYQKLNIARQSIEKYKDAEVEGNKALVEHQRYVERLNKTLEQFGITQEGATGTTESTTTSIKDGTGAVDEQGRATEEYNKTFESWLKTQREAIKTQQESVKKKEEEALFNEVLAENYPKLAESLNSLTGGYDAYVEEQLKSLKNKEKEKENLELFIAMYPKEADALGLVTEAMAKQNIELDKQIEALEAMAMISAGMKDDPNERTAADIAGDYAMATNAIMDLSNQSFAYQKMLLDNNMQSEIDAAMASGMTEEKKQAKIQNIREKYAKEERALRKKQKLPMIAQAVANTAVGVTKALEQSGPLGIALGGLVLAAGAAEVATIQAQQFAKGGQFIADKPELIMVGEKGPEAVRIQPIDRPESRALSSPSVTVNIQGNMVGNESFVRDTLVPEITRAQKLNLA